MMLLHDWALSPNCYKVRLLAALTGIAVEIRAVDLYPGAEHLSQDYLRLNPAGTLPIVEADGLTMTESSAVLAYIAAQVGKGWAGDGSAAGTAYVQQWLAFAARLDTSLGVARTISMLGGSGELARAQSDGQGCLREIEAALSDRRLRAERFLTGDTPTIADIACFPQVMLAPDGGMSLELYPAIRLWTRAVRMLSGFIEMPGIHRLHELAPQPKSLAS